MSPPNSGVRRCLLAIGSLARGGAERQTVLTARALRQRGIDARIFVASAPTTLIDDGLLADVPTDLPLSAETAPAQIARLRRAAEDLEPHAVLTFLASASWRFLVARTLSATARRSAWVVSERGNMRLDVALASPVGFAARLACLRLADRIVVNSSSLATNILSFEPSVSTKMMVVPNVLVAMDVDRALARARIRALGGDADATPVLGVLGSFQDDRNHVLLAQALPHVIATHANARLVAIGRTIGQDCVAGHARFVSELRRLGIERRVIISGEISEARALLAGFDAVVVPSKLEGSSNALAEALIAGAAIASTPVADAHQLIAGAGVVSQGWTPHALAEAILGVLADSESMRTRARARAQELVAERSLDAMGARWATLLGEALEARRAASS